MAKIQFLVTADGPAEATEIFKALSVFVGKDAASKVTASAVETPATNISAGEVVASYKRKTAEGTDLITKENVRAIAKELGISITDETAHASVWTDTIRILGERVSASGMTPVVDGAGLIEQYGLVLMQGQQATQQPHQAEQIPTTGGSEDEFNFEWDPRTDSNIIGAYRGEKAKALDFLVNHYGITFQKANPTGPEKHRAILDHVGSGAVEAAPNSQTAQTGNAPVEQVEEGSPWEDGENAPVTPRTVTIDELKLAANNYKQRRVAEGIADQDASGLTKQLIATIGGAPKLTEVSEANQVALFDAFESNQFPGAAQQQQEDF